MTEAAKYPPEANLNQQGGKHPPNCNDLSNETDDGDMKRRQDDEDDDHHHHRHHAKNDATTG